MIDLPLIGLVGSTRKIGLCLIGRGGSGPLGSTREIGLCLIGVVGSTRRSPVPLRRWFRLIKAAEALAEAPGRG